MAAMLSSLLLSAMISASGSLAPVHLRCEALVDPIGIGTPSPTLSWKLEAVNKNDRNLSQTAYRIQVGRAPGKGDLWDTGRVESDATYGIQYAGEPLKSGQPCWWRVQVWDQAGVASGWSKPATWSVGLLNPSDWQAEWIGYDAPAQVEQRQDSFYGASWIWDQGGEKNITATRTFTVEPGFEEAAIWITADDQFSLSVNGRTAGQSDGQADAWKRPVKVDLSQFLREGENTFTVTAVDYGSSAGLLARASITYPGGREVEIVTDESWQIGGRVAGVIGKYGIGPWNRVQRTLILPPPRQLRHEFEVEKPIRRAVIYGSALGLLELRLNGEAVSDELFMPGWSDYNTRVYVRAYDVTEALRSGRNAVGVLLGDGWYSGYLGYSGTRDHYGANIRALVQLEIEYQDGTKQIVASSPDWKAATGPTQEADFLMGETYDARLETSGWDEPGYDAEGWSRPDTGAEIDPLIEPFPGQPVVAYDELKPKSINEVAPDVYVLDLGQNLAGFARLRIRGKAGQKIVLRFAERLNPDGTVYTTNLRGARTIDTYICKGEGVEEWQPKFTFHGFQYIEVTGLGHKPSPDEVVGIAISSDTPTVGTFETSDPMINQLVSNAWWTQRMNFIDIPTDCPQRDERLGWTGDAQAYIRTATYFSDVQPFFTKWLVALDDSQRPDGQYPMVAPLKVADNDGGPAWDAAGVICPWVTYDMYGDRELLARHYPNMKRFVDFYVNRSKPNLLPPDSYHCFGDWLNIEDNTPADVIYMAYFAGSAKILSEAARELGHEEDARKYGGLYERVKDAFQEHYVAEDGVVAGDSQCGYILALGFDLLDDPQREMGEQHLIRNIEERNWHLSTGFVGTRDIMHVLSKIGRNDVAFRLLHNTTFPSWGFTIVNGATSIWERWDGWTPEKGFQTPGMNSFAHYAFGAVVGWMFQQPAGITNTEPGFERIRVAPQIDPNLDWLKSSYDSVRGEVVSEWSVKGDRLTLRVVIPPNAQAEIVVPGANVKSKSGLTPLADGSYRVGSGEYLFEADYSPSRS